MVYRLCINHTQQTCRRLALIQDKCYGRVRKEVRGVLSAVPIVLGVLVGVDKTPGVLLVLLGILIFYWTAGMYVRDGEKAYAETPERFRRVDYLLQDDGITVTAGGMEKQLTWQELTGLAMDGDYYYLFINNNQAYMMALPESSPEKESAFEDYLREKTGLKIKPVIPKEPFMVAMRSKLTDR